MSGSRTFRIPGPWRGALAIAPRPRGGDWLDDEMRSWRRDGYDEVLSFLTAPEEAELELTGEREAAQAAGMRFRSVPVNDREVPSPDTSFREEIAAVEAELTRGHSVVVHCRQGIGRSGMFATALLMAAGIPLGEAMTRVSESRGTAIPDTQQQVDYLERFEASLANR